MEKRAVPDDEILDADEILEIPPGEPDEGLTFDLDAIDSSAGPDIHSLQVDSEAIGSATGADTHALRLELEARFAEERGEMGARIAELEGELEALREERGAFTAELDDLQAELEQRASVTAGARGEVAELRTALDEARARCAELESIARDLERERERIQDELAGQIADVAAELAGRDQEILRLNRQMQQLVLKIESLSKGAAGGTEAGEEIERLKGELEDLTAENQFLASEVDRYATEAAERNSGK